MHNTDYGCGRFLSFPPGAAAAAPPRPVLLRTTLAIHLEWNISFMFCCEFIQEREIKGSSWPFRKMFVDIPCLASGAMFNRITRDDIMIRAGWLAGGAPKTVLVDEEA